MRRNEAQYYQGYPAVDGRCEQRDREPAPKFTTDSAASENNPTEPVSK